MRSCLRSLAALLLGAILGGMVTLIALRHQEQSYLLEARVDRA